jgi:Phosphate-induced protein 1 conserved region
LKIIAVVLLGLLLGCSSLPAAPDPFPINDAAMDEVDASDAGAITDAAAHGDVFDGSFDLWPPTYGDISYLGGRVMSHPMHVYLIWYGNWTNSPAVPIVEYLLSNFGNSNYHRINQLYYQLGVSADPPDTLDGSVEAGSGVMNDAGDQHFVSGSITFVQSLYDNYSLGIALNDQEIIQIIAQALQANKLQPDPDGLYLVITSSDVKEGDGYSAFCTDYCGWHNSLYINGVDVKFAWVGDPEECPDDCSVKGKYLEAGILNSPNGNWSADEIASLLIHEVSEITTDPNPYQGYYGWVDIWGFESEDKCSWLYSTLYYTEAGSVANVRIADKDYLIQADWVLDADGGHCGLTP